MWPDADSGGKQRSKTFDTEHDAKELLNFLNANGNSFKLAAQAATLMRSTAPTVLQTLEDHLENLYGVEPGTIVSYRSYIKNHFAEKDIARIPIDRLERRHVTAWMDSLVNPKGVEVSGKTKRNVHAFLSAALARAVDERKIPTNPAKGVRPPKSVKKTRESVFLSKAEFELIAKNIDPRFELFVRTIAGSGMRFGEITALERGDLKARDGRVTVHVTKAWKRHAGAGVGQQLSAPKTPKGTRTISLPMGLSERLIEHVKGMKRDDLVFTYTNGLRLLNGTFHDRVWQPAVDPLIESGALMDRPTVHDLRHAHASWLIDAGVPLTVIQYRLGHESVSTTSDVYGSLAKDADHRAADLLD
jgi:integrase